MAMPFSVCTAASAHFDHFAIRTHDRPTLSNVSRITPENCAANAACTCERAFSTMSNIFARGATPGAS